MRAASVREDFQRLRPEEKVRRYSHFDGQGKKVIRQCKQHF